MDLSLGYAELRSGLILFIVICASLCIHEWAHAFSADRLGDPTPRSQGRVTLNPLAHMDLVGSVVLPLLCIFVLPGSFFFGWGRPVQVNISNFKHRVRDDLIVTLAGPGSNFVLALLSAVIGGFAYRADPATAELFGLIIALNIMLGVFNLLPIPPLDGGHVLKHAVGMTEETFMRVSQWSWIGLLLLINLPPFRALLGEVTSFVAAPAIALYALIAGAHA